MGLCVFISFRHLCHIEDLWAQVHFSILDVLESSNYQMRCALFCWLHYLCSFSKNKCGKKITLVASWVSCLICRHPPPTTTTPSPTPVSLSMSLTNILSAASNSCSLNLESLSPEQCISVNINIHFHKFGCVSSSCSATCHVNYFNDVVSRLYLYGATMGWLGNVFETRIIGLQTHTTSASVLGKKSVRFICCHLWNMQLGGTFPAVLRMFYILVSVLQDHVWVAKQNPAPYCCYSCHQHCKTVDICSFIFDGLIKVQPVVVVLEMCSWRSKRNSELRKTSSERLFRHLYSHFKWIPIYCSEMCWGNLQVNRGSVRGADCAVWPEGGAVLVQRVEKACHPVSW